MLAFFLFLKTHLRAILIGIGIIVVLLTVAIVYSHCKKQVTIDSATIQKINDANEAKRKEELRETVEENAEVIRTVDQNNTIAEEDAEKREEEIDKKVNEVNKKIEDAHKQGRDVTQTELQCLLVPSDCQ